MKTNTILMLAAAAAGLYFLAKHNNPSAQPAAPGGQQPTGAPGTYAVNTSGPTGSGPTLVQQLGGASGIADGLGKLSSGLGDIWDRISAGNDTPPPDDTGGDWQSTAGGWGAT